MTIPQHAPALCNSPRWQSVLVRLVCALSRMGAPTEPAQQATKALSFMCGATDGGGFVIPAGTHVQLTCGGVTRGGTVLLCSENRGSLMIELHDGLPIPGGGAYVNMVPLLLKDDGQYHELLGDSVVELQLTPTGGGFMSARLELKVDPTRWPEKEPARHVTGIYVRASVPEGGFDSVDIYCLDRDSLMRWLRSRGGTNQLAESTVALLLGHSTLPGEDS